MMSTKKVFAGLLAIFSLAWSCRGWGQPSSAVYEVIEPADFRDSLASDPSILLLDVRRPSEYEAGHIEGAENVNILEASSFEERMRDRDREQPVYLYCRSGRRSQRAAKKLEDMGFSRIVDLKGGFLAWEDERE